MIRGILNGITPSGKKKIETDNKIRSTLDGGKQVNLHDSVLKHPQNHFVGGGKIKK